MNGTGPKEMRELLSKYWALMKDSFGSGVIMEIITRGSDDKVWFFGYVAEEEAKVFNSENYLAFSAYAFCSVEENENVLKTVEEFINNHKK